MPLPFSLTSGQALFLDFDGTLVDLAASPDAIRVEPTLTASLRRLQERLGGALALISGRSIADLDRWLHPLVLPAAGVHGAERRSAGGAVKPLNVPSLEAVAACAQRLAQAHPGVRVERKGAAVALHYREAPGAEAACVEAFGAAVAAAPGLRLLHGKMVLEALPLGVSKGHAVEAFLAEPPFEGRQPVFIGDDVTDEAGFDAVQRRGGLAVKVGPGETMATERLAGAAEVRQWLAAQAMQDPRKEPHAARA
jgi:trehalose 6-phosphate phosphatase